MINFKLSDNRDEAITQLINHHKSTLLPRYQNLFNYYIGKHAITNKTADSNAPNNKIVNPYPAFIVNTVQGYFLGQPVMYESKDLTYVAALNLIFDDNSEDDQNMEMEKTLSIMGEAFELVFLDEEAQVKFVQIPNTQTIVHYNNNLKPQIDMALRYYDELDINNIATTKVELYTAEKIIYMTQNGATYTIDDEQIHYFKEVPVIHYFNNKEITGDFEIAMSLIDDYDKTLSNNSNEFEYFRNAYLILKGFDGTDDADIAEAVQKRAFKTSEDGDISFLTKEVNDTAVMNHLKTLDQNIHKACNIPNLTDEAFASNLSGVALKYKLWGFENLISAKERKFTRSLTERIRLITIALNIKGHAYDWKTVYPKFTRNLPSNVLENSEIIKNLETIIPIENLVTLLPFIDDKKEFLASLESNKTV